ncbi:MAG: PIN domain-containing protein [Candidatus Paceibacterota bacterium]|jgi:predicted nucleic-acid-binding protein
MKEGNYFIDTNIFLRMIVKDDKQSAKDCELLFNKIKQGEISATISTLILAEIQWTLKSFYGLEKQQITTILKSISEMKYLKIRDKHNATVMLELYEKHNVKFIDALIASCPDILNKKMTVISFDKDFDKLKILRKEPKDLL